MTGISYLKQRGSAFYVRVRVPKDLAPVLGKKEIVEALRTSDKAAAKRRLPEVIGRINEMFDGLRGGKALTSRDIEAELQSVAVELLSTLQQDRLAKSKRAGRSASDDRQYTYSDELRDLAADYWGDYEEDDFTKVRALASKIIARVPTENFIRGSLEAADGVL